jgi:hypothetical protein
MSDNEIIAAANDLWRAGNQTEARLLYRYLGQRRRALGIKLDPDGAA